MPLNVPFTAGRAEDSKLYEWMRTVGQQALKSQDIAATAPITITRGASGTPVTIGLNSGLQPSALAYNTIAQSIPNATFTALTFDSNIYDNGVHSTTVNNSRFTVPSNSSGWYTVTAQVTWSASAAGATRLIALIKNGAVYLQQQSAANSGIAMQTCVSWQGRLDAGDYVEARVYQDSGVALNTIGAAGNCGMALAYASTGVPVINPSIVNTGGLTSLSAGVGITLTPNPIVSTGAIALTVPVVPSSGGTGTTTAFTTGSVVFAGASGVYSQNNGNFFWDDATPGLRLGGSTRQMTPSFLAVRGAAGSQIEFGHSNTAGYGSSLGATVTNGLPFLTFSCEAGTTAETFRTRGIKGNIIEADTAGNLLFGQATTANADNQTLTERMRISSTGLVGVGTAAPDSRLTASDNTVVPAAITDTTIHGVAADTKVARVALDSIGAATAFTGRRANGTTGALTGLVADDAIAQVTALGYTSAGAYSSGARGDFRIHASETWSATAQGAYATIRTTPNGSTTIAERVRVDPAGNVGVNTTAPASKLHVDGGTTAGSVVTGTATWTNGSATVTGSGFSASWAGSQIAETTTASSPGFLILSATATTITLSTPYSGTTGSKGYAVLLRNNTQTLSGFTADHANGLYAYVGTGQNDTYGIFIDANADTTDTGAAINVSNFGNADAIHIGLENRASGTPRATGIGIDMNRCLYPSYASTGLNIANFSGLGGATDNGFWSNVVLTGQVGGAGSMIDMQADGPIIVVSPASSAWVAGADVIRLWSQPSHAGSIAFSLKGSGVYSSSGQFRSSATDASAQTIANNTLTALTFTTNTTDVGSIHSTSTNTSRFTVPASNVGGDGWYLASAQVEFASNTTGIRLIDVYKNGTTRLAYHDNLPCTGGNATALQVTWQGALAAGDYIEFRVFQDSGGNLNTVAGVAHTFGTISKLF